MRRYIDRGFDFIFEQFSHPWLMTVIVFCFVMMFLGEVVFLIGNAGWAWLQPIGIAAGSASFFISVLAMASYLLLLVVDRVTGRIEGND